MAGKNYKLTMKLSDGSEKSVEFTAPEGPAGPRGETGKTAYEYAVAGGYTGTEEEFAAKLAAENSGGSASADAVLYTAQTLTEDQKTQARANIGAGTSSVEIDTSLSASGKAADSKTVGDKFTSVGGTLENVAMMAKTAMPGSLKWDGIIGDRAYVAVNSEDGLTQCYVHISDETVNDIIIQQGGVQGVCYINSIEGGEVTPVSGQINEDGSIFIQFAVMIPSDNFTLDGFTFPKKGWYFMSASAIDMGVDLSVYHVSALYIAYNPFPESSSVDEYFEDVRTISERECGDTLTWDGNTDGYEVADGGYAVRVSSSIPTVEDLANGYTTTYIDADGIAHTFEGSVDDAEFGANEDGYISAETFAVVPCDGYNNIYPKAGVYFANATELRTASLTIPGYSFMGILAENNPVIKTEHLPEHSHKWEDIEEKPTSVSQFKNDAGYVTEDTVASQIEAAIGAAIAASY